MSIQETNLRALGNYYFGKREQRALAYLERASDEKRARTLESHLLREPSQKAQGHRDDLDYLLRYYSVLELAILTGASGDLPAEIAAPARQILKDRYVQRYYEWYYPLLLPQLFRARLDGSPIARGGIDATDAFLRFIALDPLRDDEDTATFLSFLDDRTVYLGDDVHSLGSVMTTIATPAQLLAALAGPEGDATPTDQGVRGFFHFLSFSRSLHEVLDTVEEPLVRSAFWHYHGYWYQLIGGQVLGAILTGIQALAQYVADDPAGDRSVFETHKDMAQAARSLQMLTSSIYRIHLEEALFRPRLRVATIGHEIFVDTIDRARGEQ